MSPQASGDGEEPTEWERQAVALVEQLRERQQLRGFGMVGLVPRRDYTLADLRLNKIQPESLLSPRDVTLEGVRNGAWLALAAGVLAWAAILKPMTEQLLSGGLTLATLVFADQLGNNGAVESLAVDSLGRLMNPSYSVRVSRHEAGHFLVAYLCGVLPRAYTLSGWDAFVRYKAKNVQAGTLLCDASFRAEVESGKLSASTLDAFTCVALAGVASEYLAFGQAEGGLDDIRTLDALLQALSFSQKRADSQVRYAVLSVVFMLRRHAAAHDALVQAMTERRSIGDCILAIEKSLTFEG